MNGIYNFYQHSDLWTTSGQPKEQQFQELAKAGCKAVINLAMPDSDRAIPTEASIVTGLGMAYFHIPVPFDAPSVHHMKLFVGLMNTLKGEKLHVHCAINARVSAFMYLYRTLVKGDAPEDAMSPILEEWKPKMDDIWKQYLQMGKSDLGL